MGYYERIPMLLKISKASEKNDERPHPRAEIRMLPKREFIHRAMRNELTEAAFRAYGREHTETKEGGLRRVIDAPAWTIEIEDMKDLMRLAETAPKGLILTPGTTPTVTLYDSYIE